MRLTASRRTLGFGILLTFAAAASAQQPSPTIPAPAPAAVAAPAPSPVNQPGGPFSGPAPAPPPLTGDMLQKPGVPAGTLSPMLTLRSAVYDSMASTYQIYVPAQYDPKKPAAVMVFQDGSGYARRDGDHPALNVLDNLIAEGKIPVIIAVFTNPGDITVAPGTPTFQAVESLSQRHGWTVGNAMRSTEYDTVSDRYVHFVRDELLAEVGKHYSLRQDAYSHAIAGLSSGGICAFNAAWQMPDEFSRVLSWIGSFVSLEWHENPNIPDGGQDYPDKVLREGHRNLRVWLQDGSNDQENPDFGSWPLANLRMANALKLRGYDFRFSFGQGPHTAAEGGAEMVEELTWLWRGYDPSRTAETFTQDPAETAKPPFRVGIVNRKD